MNYNSTRNAALQVTAAQAIAQGISEEGGLFVPPKIKTAMVISTASFVRGSNKIPLLFF